MKKKNFLLCAITAGLISAIVIPVNVLADSSTTGTVIYQSGTVSLDPNAQLPTDLNFGSHPIQSATNENWLATSDGDQSSPLTTSSVEVLDNRGTGVGWSVKLAQVAQFASGADSLTGAELSITAGAITNNLGSEPTGASIENSTLALNPGTVYPVMTANTDQGDGDTLLPLTQFELAVPSSANKRQTTYTTTLNWTFSSSP